MPPVVKRSVSLPAELFAELEAEARAEGVSISALLSEAMEHTLRIRRGLRAVAEWEAEHGAFTEEELRQADDVLREARVIW